jgi:hypothetical protein
MEGTFNRSNKVVRVLFGITREDEELKLTKNDQQRLQQYTELCD